jgi:hypothetical protein
MRHRTTGYDGMVIPRVKGRRREVRRMLARRSQDCVLPAGVQNVEISARGCAVGEWMS